jgi:hypothetical protein
MNEHPEDAMAGEDDSGTPEDIRRSLARGGRPRVGRRFDAAMRTARASRPDPAPDRRRAQLPAPQRRVADQLARWSSPDEPAGGQPDRPPEPVADQALRPDELAVLRTEERRPGRFGGAGGRVLGIAWPPPAAAVLIVTVIALLTFGLGTAVGAWLRPAPEATVDLTGTTEPARATSPPTTAPPTTAPPTTAAPVRAPQACLDTARHGDQLIALLTARVRDRRLDDALLRYAAASQACREAAERR